MVRIWGTVLFSLLFAAQSEGAIQLVTDHSTGTPLMMNAGSVSGSPMTLSIISDANDEILGWQTTLWILPVGGATGSVSFNSTAQPANYVFGSRSLIYSENLSFPTTPDGMFAFDLNVDAAGNLLPPVAVPGGPGLNLNELSFSASVGASGLFGVFAVGGLGKSEWTDSNLAPTLFNNLDPTPDSHTQIGEILVGPVIPEPGALVVWILMLCGGALGHLRLRSKRGR